MAGDSKVPRMSIITTTKFSQSILTFKILSCKRAIHRELNLKLPRHFLWTAKIYKKKRMAEWMQESMEGMTKGYIDDLPRISAHVMISPLPWLSVCLILYWYCKEKFCLGHSCEWRVNSRDTRKARIYCHFNCNFQALTAANQYRRIVF